MQSNLGAPGGLVLKTRGQVVAVVLVALASVLLAGCPPRESIAKINLDPARYAGKEISIAGTVTDSFGGLGRGVFQVDDGSGRMWVLSTGYGVPGTGARVAVVGIVEQGFSFGGRTFGTLLRETERRH